MWPLSAFVKIKLHVQQKLFWVQWHPKFFLIIDTLKHILNTLMYTNFKAGEWQCSYKAVLRISQAFWAIWAQVPVQLYNCPPSIGMGQNMPPPLGIWGKWPSCPTPQNHLWTYHFLDASRLCLPGFTVTHKSTGSCRNAFLASNMTRTARQHHAKSIIQDL